MAPYGPVCTLFLRCCVCIPLTVQCVHFPYGFNVYFSPYGQVCSFPLRSGVYFILSSQCVQPPNHLPCGPVCTFHSGPVSSFPLRRSLYFVLTIQCVLSGESFPLTVQCVLSPYNPVCTFPYGPAGLATYVQCVLFRYCPVRTFSSSYGPVVPLVNTIRNIDRYQVNGNGNCMVFDAPKHVIVRRWILRFGQLAGF